MDGDPRARRPFIDAHAVVAQAERVVAEQAGITIGEARVRIALYAHFYDLALVAACQGVVDGTISLLNHRERRRQPPSTGAPV